MALADIGEDVIMEWVSDVVLQILQRALSCRLRLQSKADKGDLQSRRLEQGKLDTEALALRPYVSIPALQAKGTHNCAHFLASYC